MGTHQLENILKIPDLTAVNNSAMGNAEAFGRLVNAVHGRLAVELQDGAPLEPEVYYKKIFAGIDDFTGFMVATFVQDDMGIDNDGRAIRAQGDVFARANAIVRAVRAAAEERMKV